MKMLKSSLAVLLLLFVISGDSYPQNDVDYQYDDAEDPVPEEEDKEEAAGPPPKFAVESDVIKTREGVTVHIPCHTEKPNNHVLLVKYVSDDNLDGYLLFAGEARVTHSRRYNMSNSTLTITKVKKADAGTYVCRYQHKTDSVEVQHILDVQYPPKMTKRVQDQEVVKEDSVSLECNASGNPVPNITWTRVDGHMPSGEESVQGRSLILDEVDRHVEGTYRCTADNTIGNPVYAEMTLTVNYPPEIFTEKEIIRTGEGDRVELVCVVHARPAADLTWTKNGESVDTEGNVEERDGGHRHVLEITPVMEQNFGSYRCSATNSYGEKYSDIALTDLPRTPLFTSNPTGGEEASYTLTWNTESYYPIKEYRIRIRKTKANESTEDPGPWSEDIVVPLTDNIDLESNGLEHKMKHTFDNLESATNYQALVQVKNKDKWGEEAMFIFSTKKASPTTTTTSTTAPYPTTLAENPYKQEVSSHQTTGGSAVLFPSLLVWVVASIAVPCLS